MDFSKALFPVLVFLGGCCYGPMSPMVKMSYQAGFSASDVLMSQYAFGWVILALLTAGFFLFGFAKKKNSASKKLPGVKQFAGLVLAGILIALVSGSYIFALQSIPAYVAVILLFQFTWIGVIIQAVAERRLPNKRTVISVIILLAGTVLASGIIGQSVELNPVGCLFGFASAVFYAFYIFLMGRVNVSMHPMYRSFLIMSCSLVFLILLLSPSYFTSGVIFEGMWKYGLVLGVGCAAPMFLFAIGTPKISTGASTILSSSELPASIICVVLILGEQVSMLQWVGVALLFFGIALPYIGKKKETLQKI